MLRDRPLAVELFAGTGSGTAGWCDLGGRAVHFDLEYLPHHGKPHPAAQRVIQNVLTLHGSQFKDAAFIWGSPPCQNYSYLAMPWSRSTDPNNSKKAKALRKKWETEGPDNRLFDACFRIQREAIEATGEPCPDCKHLAMYTISTLCARCNCTGRINTRYIPLIVENVRGAIPWVGPSKANYGSFHLWGDVEMVGNRIFVGDEWKRGGAGLRVPGRGAEKVPGFRFDGSERSFQTASVEAHGVKVPSGEGRRTDVGKGARFTSRDCGVEAAGTKQTAGRGDWFSKEARDGGASARFGSKSSARKAASAMIAKIPFPLSAHIAEQFWPAGERIGSQNE